MNILWIEDFKDIEPEELAESIFYEILLENSFDDYESNTDVEEALPILFQKNSIHSIEICKSFQKWKQNKYIQKLNDYDIVLIDINLEGVPTDDREKPIGFQNEPDFDKRAGFFIYNSYIRNGFPDDNIAFFTANEPDALSKFEEACRELRIEKPKHSFQKNSQNDNEKLRKLLQEKSQNNYIVLRRGIIECCRELWISLETIPETDENQINEKIKFFKFKNNSELDNIEQREYSLSYLTKLERFLPIRMPKNQEKETLFSLFVKELASDWEMVNSDFIKDQFKKKGFEISFPYKMKLLRNWTAHNMLPENLKEKDLAYLFIIAIRSWFNIEPQATNYEKILFELFDPIPEVNYQEKLQDELEIGLAQSCYNLLKFPLKINRRDAKCFAKNTKKFLADFVYSLRTLRLFSLFLVN